MKTSTCIVVLFCLLHTTTINAQSNPPGRFHAGLSLGLIASDIDGADNVDNDNDFNKVGFTAGGIVNTQLNAKNIFQFEINYIQKGSMGLPDSNNNNYYKIALNYIEVPFLIRHRAHIPFLKKLQDNFDVEGGVSIGRLMSNNVKGTANTLLNNTDVLFNKTDVSIQAGLDYNFSKNIYLCFRYSHSVIPAIKRNQLHLNNVRYTFDKGNNMVFQFSLKFVFGAKGEEPAQ